jgi:VWFA-related protein
MRSPKPSKNVFQALLRRVPSRLHASLHAFWLLFPLFLLLLASAPLRSQQEPSFSTDVKVVNVLATVRDKQGQIVRNLTKEDFTLEEDGRPQTIRYFAQETDLPLTLGLLVDTSLSQRRVMEEERTASYVFLDQVLRETKDMAFVIHFEGEVELLQDLTSSRQQLEEALGSLRTPQPPGGGRRSGPSPWPGSGPGTSPSPIPRPRGRYAGGGTALYDAVFLASDELMKKQTGRKAIIILSDGVDNASKVTLLKAIEAAQRSDTVVYSILFSDEEAYSTGGGFGHGGWGGMGGGGGMGRRGGGRRFPQTVPHPDGKKILERISHETGGRLFEVSKKHSITQIYSSIQEELRNQYSLGYTPEITGAALGYRRIRLTARQKDWIVQSRDGYYAEQ